MIQKPSNLSKLGIPAKVLKGEVPQFQSVASIYRSVFAQQFMLRVHTAFWEKAMERSDDLGNAWKPLAPATHRSKPLSPMEGNHFQVLKNWYNNLDQLPSPGSSPNVGLLSPAYKQIFNTAFRKELRKLIQESGARNSPRGSRKLLIQEATRRAWTAVKQRPIHGAVSRFKIYEKVEKLAQIAGARGQTDIYKAAKNSPDLVVDYQNNYQAEKARIYRVIRKPGFRGAIYVSESERHTLINIRTGALVAATRPGTISNNRYYPPPGQHIALNPRSILIDFPTIPYFNAVQEVRPVIPDNAGAWIEQAHQVAIKRAKMEYDRIRHDYKNRTKSPTNKAKTRSRVGRT